MCHFEYFLVKVQKFLDSSGSKLNYRLYGEYLFDVLFAGGVLGMMSNLHHSYWLDHAAIGSLNKLMSRSLHTQYYYFPVQEILLI